MKLKDLKCVSKNVNLDDYYDLYYKVRNNMNNPKWLGVITRDYTELLLKNNGKIWLYYDNDIPVCSVFYIPSNKVELNKYNINSKEEITGSIGPLMIRDEYIGNGLMNEMIKVLEDYCKSININYLYTKACKDNIFSINNLIKNDYVEIFEYENNRGKNSVFIKEI